MKNKKRLLWPESKCCLKKFLELEFLSKYGTIFVILFSIFVQCLNIAKNINYELSFFSILINLFFLIVVLTKLKIIKINFLKNNIDFLIKFMIFIFLLNFVAYLFSDNLLEKYLYGPISFLGAYFLLLLLKREDINPL